MRWAATVKPSTQPNPKEHSMSDLDMYAETDPGSPAKIPTPVVIVPAHTATVVDVTPAAPTPTAVVPVTGTSATADADADAEYDGTGEVRMITHPGSGFRWPSTRIIRFVLIAIVAVFGWNIISGTGGPGIPGDPNATPSGEGVLADAAAEMGSGADIVVADALDNADAYRAATGTYAGWPVPDGVRVASNADTVIVSAADTAGCQMGASTPQGRGVQTDPTGAACSDAAIGQAQADLDAAGAAQPAANPVGPDIGAVAASAANYWSANTIGGGVGFGGLTAELIPGATAVVVSPDGGVADIWFAAADGCTHTQVNAAAQVTVVGYDCM